MNANVRGVVDPITLLIVAAIATQLVPNWRVTHWFKKAPPTAQLSQLQTELTQLQQERDAAAKEAKRLADEKAANTQTQLRYSQQMVAGVPVALKNEQQTPGVRLATSLATRASAGLNAAIGDLPRDRQDEILKIVADALSGAQDQVDSANAKLAARDADLAAANARIKEIEPQLVQANAEIKTKDQLIEQKSVAISHTTAQVADFAQKYYQASRENGSLSATASRALWGIVILAILYAIVHFVLPSLDAEFPHVKLLNTAYRAITSVASSHTITPPKPPIP